MPIAKVPEPVTVAGALAVFGSVITTGAVLRDVVVPAGGSTVVVVTIIGETVGMANDIFKNLICSNLTAEGHRLPGRPVFTWGHLHLLH